MPTPPAMRAEAAVDRGRELEESTVGGAAGPLATQMQTRGAGIPAHNVGFDGENAREALGQLRRPCETRAGRRHSTALSNNGAFSNSGAAAHATSLHSQMHPPCNIAFL